jgi:hypothetical protein
MRMTAVRLICIVFLVAVVNTNCGHQPVFEYRCMEVIPDPEKRPLLKDFVRSPVARNDTISFTHCFGGGYCRYAFKMVMKKDTLKILDSCASEKMLHMSDFCVACRIYRLKKGVYYLNYQGNPPVRLEIK